MQSTKMESTPTEWTREGTRVPTECAVCGEPESLVTLFDCEKCSNRSYCCLDCQIEDLPTHQRNCDPPKPNYVLRVDLFPNVLFNPKRVTRTLSCPNTATIAALHWAIVVAFGWTNTVSEFQYRMVAKEVRNALLPLDKAKLPAHYQPGQRASEIKLRHVIEDPNLIIKQADDREFLNCTYNRGVEHWKHSIFYVGLTDATAQFLCLDGEGHGCAEGLGGSRHLRRLLIAYDARKPDADQREILQKSQKYSREWKNPQVLPQQLKWNWDKDRVNRLLSELDVHPHSVDPSLSKRPSILLISLNRGPQFGEKYREVIATLRKWAIVREVTNQAAAMYHLSKDHVYHAVIVTDPAIFELEFTELSEELMKYAGGSVQRAAVIFGFPCGMLVDQTKRDRLDRTFKNVWCKNWKAGDYLSSTFRLNPQANHYFTLRLDSLLTEAYNLPKLIDMEALNLKVTDSMREPIYIEGNRRDQSPVVFANYYNGYVGWLGALNDCDETIEILLKMCGV